MCQIKQGDQTVLNNILIEKQHFTSIAAGSSNINVGNFLAKKNLELVLSWILYKLK